MGLKNDFEWQSNNITTNHRALIDNNITVFIRSEACCKISKKKEALLAISYSFRDISFQNLIGVNFYINFTHAR